MDLGTTITNRNKLHDEIRRGIHCGNVQFLFNSKTVFVQSSFPKRFKIRTYKMIILSVVLHGCETLPFLL
jgi:hypothetical protein